MSSVKNCHYVTRSITKPWEHSLENKPRQLHYLDLIDNQIKTDSSKKLFSKEYLFSDYEETRFNQLFESPIGILKKEYLEKDSIEDYKIFRAIYLYFLIQMGRIDLAFNKTTGKTDIQKLISLKDDEINYVVEGARENTNVVRIKPLESQPLFFPEVGFFIMPVLSSNNGYYYNVVALPLMPDTAILLAPKQLHMEDLEFSRNSLCAFSIGLNPLNTKLLIPDLNWTMDYSALIKLIETQKKHAVNIQETSQKANLLIKEMYHIAGLNFPH